LSDLRESGAIEQDADMVLFIHRPEYYKITEDENGNSLIGVAELIIAKHRNGATGDVRLRFRQELARFEDYNASSMDDFATPITLGSRMNSPSEPAHVSASQPSPTPDFAFKAGFERDAEF
jgi:replicative DNA helicase